MEASICKRPCGVASKIALLNRLCCDGSNAPTPLDENEVIVFASFGAICKDSRAILCNTASATAVPATPEEAAANGEAPTGELGPAELDEERRVRHRTSASATLSAHSLAREKKSGAASALKPQALIKSFNGVSPGSPAVLGCSQDVQSAPRRPGDSIF